MNIPESWDHHAHLLGYENEEEMLKDLYVKQGFSFADLSRKLGYSQGNVRRRLMFLGIPIRPRGGKNRTGITKLMKLSNLELAGKPDKIAEALDVSISTVFGERRRRKRHEVSDDSTTLVPQGE